nr:hypothetical protein [Candidatus Sigynarchaeota archaeon]
MKGSAEREVHACSAGLRQASCNDRFGQGRMGNGLGDVDDNGESLDARRETAAGISLFFLYVLLSSIRRRDLRVLVASAWIYSPKERSWMK